MTVRGTISRSFQIFADRFPVLLGITAVTHIPAFLFIALLAIIGLEATEENLKNCERIQDFLNGFCRLFSQAALVHVVFNSLLRKPLKFSAALSIGMKNAGRVFVISFVVGILTGVAALALVIPGLIVSMILYVAVPAAVVEDLRVRKALGRSRELTNGRRGTLFLIVLCMFAFALIALLGVVGISMAVGETAPGALALRMGAALLLMLPVSMLESIAASIAYHDLRVEKEGLDTDVLASVFD